MEATEKHLVFQVHDQQFTISVSNISSIIQIPRIFHVPQAPDYILGVINVEGEVIPVVNTGTKLSMKKIDVEEKAQVIIFSRQTDQSNRFQKLGFLVSQVNDVVDIDPKKIQTLPTSKYHFDERLVEGMHKIDGEFCMQINLDNFYKDELNEILEQQLL